MVINEARELQCLCRQCDFNKDLDKNSWIHRGARTHTRKHTYTHTRKHTAAANDNWSGKGAVTNVTCRDCLLSGRARDHMRERKGGRGWLKVLMLHFSSNLKMFSSPRSVTQKLSGKSLRAENIFTSGTCKSEARSLRIPVWSLNRPFPLHIPFFFHWFVPTASFSFFLFFSSQVLAHDDCYN